jgi:acetolactate synthase-1/2/3 large subunit
MQQYRHHYQEIDHIQPFAAVTKYNVTVDSAAQLPLLLRQAFRSATSGAPGPAHLDLQGTTGNVIMDAEADLDVVVEGPFTHVPPFRSEPEMALAGSRAR